MLQFQWLLHQQHFLGDKHMNLRLKEVKINSKNTIFFSPLIGNIRLSLHAYINSLSSLFVIFFGCRWDIFWSGSIAKDRIDLLREESLFEGEFLNVDDVIAFCLYITIQNAVESYYLPFCVFLIQ